MERENVSFIDPERTAVPKLKVMEIPKKTLGITCNCE